MKSQIFQKIQKMPKKTKKTKICQKSQHLPKKPKKIQEAIGGTKIGLR
jgi:hypothetical protein